MQTQETQAKSAYISAYVPPELKRRAGMAAAQLGVTRGEVIRRALQEYLDQLDAAHVTEKPCE